MKEETFSAAGPLVTVVCLCHQHAPFVRQSLQSVLQQTYAPIELIVVDDASTDGSQREIADFLEPYPHVRFLALPENIGNCRAFNQALALARGKYIIDLAADDLLLPERVARQVQAFESLTEDYAVVFSDARFIDAQGQVLQDSYYPRDAQGRLLEPVPQGEIYARLLRNPPLFSSPTQMMRTSVLRELGGYDEALAYEDYDFWVRSGRHYRYHFLDAVTTAKRVLPAALSQQFYNRRRNALLDSTYRICRKAQALNRSREEDMALACSVSYHMRLCWLTDNGEVGRRFARLLAELRPLSLSERVVAWGLALRLPVSFLYMHWRKRQGLRW